MGWSTLRNWRAIWDSCGTLWSRPQGPKGHIPSQPATLYEGCQVLNLTTFRCEGFRTLVSKKISVEEPNMKQIPLVEKPTKHIDHINSYQFLHKNPKKGRSLEVFANGMIEVEKIASKKKGPDLLGWKNADVSMEVSTATSL